MTKRFLLDRALAPEDLAEMHKWLAIYHAEVQRIVNICNNWNGGPK